LKPEDSYYTWGDLLVDSTMTVATSNGISILKGSEYNAYLMNNENSLKSLMKRSNNTVQAQRNVVNFICSEKLLGIERNRNKAQSDTTGIGNQISSLTTANLITQDINLMGINSHTYLDYMKNVKDRRIAAMQVKINHWRAVLQGNAPLDSDDSKLVIPLGYETYSEAQIAISKTISDNDVQGWMQKEQYKGSLPVARMLYAQELLMKHIADLIAQANVQVMIR
jgi:hypothetical protein